MKTFGLGLVGCGGMGRSLAVSANQIGTLELNTNEKTDDTSVAVKVISVCDTNPSLSKKLSQDIGSEMTTNYLDLLEDSRINAILIATPPFLHKSIAVDSATAGKHVFTEKPMATSLVDCDHMIQAAQSNGIQLGVGLVCRFHAVHSKVRELVHSGQYGRPISMKVHRTGGPWPGELGHWRMKREECGGFLMEVNAHEIDFMRWTLSINDFDHITRVYASGGRYLQENSDYADLVFLNMTLSNGTTGFLHAGQVSAAGEYGGSVDCEQASIHFPNIWGANSAIEIRTFDSHSETILAKDILIESPVKAEIQAFIEAILENRSVPVTGIDGRAATEIALAAYDSIDSGRAISLPL